MWGKRQFDGTVRREMVLRKGREFWKRSPRWLRMGGGLLVLFLLFLALPVVGFRDPCNTVLEDDRGELLSARITPDGQWRFPDADSVPRRPALCIRYFEDEYFFRHPGVNPVSLVRALGQNIRAGEVVRGGSTLTMQVVRLSRKNKPRTVGQKVLEMILALRLELARSKEEILILYASHAPFGGNVVGLDAASWRYYGRPAHKLSWGESAALAVLPNAPSLVHPGRNRDRLLEKRNRLLQKLADKGVIDGPTAELAMGEELPGQPRPLPDLVPHLLSRSEQEGHGGSRLHTTLDGALQEQVLAAVSRHHARLRENEIHNAAVLVLDLEERSVKAYVGNTPTREEDGGRHVDILAAPRSSGSILKPLLYAGMLDEGQLLPDMLVPDIPTHIAGYSPSNFDHAYRGAAPASTALVQSLNIPAVRMLQEFGLEKFHGMLRELGFGTVDKSPGHYGLTLILGGAEVTLWDLGRVYMGMANSLSHIRETGYRYRPSEYDPPSYLRDGDSRERPGTDRGRPSGIFSAAAIWDCFETLTRLERPGLDGSWEQFSSSRRVAWKTGTSFGFRDAWAVGVTPRYLVAVWAGNADGEGRPGLTGLHAAAPLMFDVFGLLPATGWFQPPLDELEEVRVCAQSGFLASPRCEETVLQRVPPAGARSPICPYHQIAHLDESGRYRVTSACYPVADIRNRPWFVLPPAMAWYYERSHPGYRPLPPFLPGCEGSGQESMALIYPDETRDVYIPRDLDGRRGRIVLEAVHRDPDSRIFWHLDDRYLGETRYTHQMECDASEGMHTLVLVDGTGGRLEKTFRVLDQINP
ncbi:MAG: penicillin-binding protein 1C [Bacteroidales bacterium]